MNLERLARWASAALIGVATVTSLNVAAETATLRVSIEGGSFNSKFNYRFLLTQKVGGTVPMWFC